MGDLQFILVAVLAFVSVAGIGWVFAGDSGGAAKKKRLKAVSAGAGASVRARGRKANPADVASARRRQVQEPLKQLEDRQRKQRRKSLTLQAQLRQAGLTITPLMFWLIS